MRAQIADAAFSQPYYDIDDGRDAPDRHRYTHGGFEGAEAGFSIYLPPEDADARRQNLSRIRVVVR